MPGQLPTKGRKIVIDDFVGVIQTFDETLIPPGGVAYSYGLIDTEERKLERLGGKYPLPNSSVPLESIISIQQLNFATSSFLLTHCTSHRAMYDDYDAEVEELDGISEYAL